MPRGVLSSQEILSHSLDLLSPKMSEEKSCLDENEFKIIQHQMQSDFEIQINSVKKKNSEALEKGKLQIYKLNIFKNSLVSAKEMHNLQLLKEMEFYRKELDINVVNVQNNANEMILQLNKQELLERNDMDKMHSENITLMEEKFKINEKKLNESLKTVKEREDLWEKEKTEVLEEVQNLKAEALQMVTKLALEYEEESTGTEKRRSLSQEVFCLQIIVEMKTDEMRNLREQVALTEQELEQFEITKKRLSTVLARIEDLEEQITIKERVER